MHRGTYTGERRTGRWILGKQIVKVGVVETCLVAHFGIGVEPSVSDKGKLDLCPGVRGKEH